MNYLRLTLVALAAALIAAFVYQQQELQKLQADLAKLGRDGDALRRDLGAVSRQLSAGRRDNPAPPPMVTAPSPVKTSTPPPAPRVEEPLPPGATATAPAGWMKNGSKPGAYVVGVDRLRGYGGMPAAFVMSTEPKVDGFGGMMQMSSAEEHLGKRLRLSGWARTEDANDGGGHLWFRIDGQQRGVSLQFDNMDSRPIKGTTDWQHYSVVLDVPTEASALAYGFFVNGTGKMWVSGAKMEVVGPEVPSTNMIKDRARSLPKTPVNLSFNPDPPGN